MQRSRASSVGQHRVGARSDENLKNLDAAAVTQRVRDHGGHAVLDGQVVRRAVIEQQLHHLLLVGGACVEEHRAVVPVACVLCTEHHDMQTVGFVALLAAMGTDVAAVGGRAIAGRVIIERAIAGWAIAWRAMARGVRWQRGRLTTGAPSLRSNFASSMWPVRAATCSTLMLL